MRNMSFAKTTAQARARTKDITRRLGWGFLKPGDLVQQVVKGMGLKKGEKVEKIHVIRIKSTRWEPLNAIDQDDVRREGFPQWTPQQFVDFFVKESGKPEYVLVNRIEFEYMHLCYVMTQTWDKKLARLIGAPRLTQEYRPYDPEKAAAFLAAMEKRVLDGMQVRGLGSRPSGLMSLDDIHGLPFQPASKGQIKEWQKRFARRCQKAEACQLPAVECLTCERYEPQGDQ